MWLNIRVCAQTAKHGLEGLEIGGRPAHIEFWTPPGAAYLPMPMVAPPAPPPPPPAGWSSAPIAAPSSPSGYVGMFAAPSPSYGSYTWVGLPLVNAPCPTRTHCAARSSTAVMTSVFQSIASVSSSQACHAQRSVEDRGVHCNMLTI